MKNTMEMRDDEILVAFAEALEQSQTPTVVRDWMERYPAQARMISRFAAEQRRGASVLSNAAYAPYHTISTERVRTVALEMVRERRAAALVNPPLKSLLEAVRARGMDTAAAAAALEVPFGVFVKLHRRLIAAESVPTGFMQKMAETIGRSVDEISAYLHQPPMLATGASYRADDTPSIGEQEPFADALRSDPEATHAQQARWLTETGGGGD